MNPTPAANPRRTGSLGGGLATKRRAGHGPGPGGRVCAAFALVAALLPRDVLPHAVDRLALALHRQQDVDLRVGLLERGTQLAHEPALTRGMTL